MIKYCFIYNWQPYMFKLSEYKLYKEVDSVIGKHAIIAMEDILRF